MPIFQPALTAPGQGYRSPRSIALSQTNQKKRFGTVVEKVAALPKAHRDIFKLLMDMGGKAFSLDEIAPMLGLSATTLKNAPPLALVEMGLLRREGQRGYYRYASIAQTMLSEHYPDLDASELFEQLLQEISRR
jgi:predicted transcriptional regulator